MSTQEKFYIQVDENGNAVNHPAFESNLLQAFPDGIPSNWELFEHTPSNNPPRMWDMLERRYVKTNGVWTNVTVYRSMDETERAEATTRYINQLQEDKLIYIERATFLIKERENVFDSASAALLIEYKSNLEIWNLVALGDSFENFCSPPFPLGPMRQEDGTWVAR
jgi:hypothetical protein